MSKSPSLATTVLMVPPIGFAYNTETAATNKFQHEITSGDTKSSALDEFNKMVAVLRQHGIKVILLNQLDTLPDAVFPNNWFSTHKTENGTSIILYNMLTPNRQAEVNLDNLAKALASENINIDKVMDLRPHKKVLEGTGSLVFDHPNKIVYATRSERTDELMVKQLAHQLNYTAVIFSATDTNKMPFYHTNVMMAIGKDFAVACLECILNKDEREIVLMHLRETKKVIIPLTQQQVHHMCGNILELVNDKGEHKVVMSQNAYQHFSDKQLKTIQEYAEPIVVDIKTIETVGGGSARCMMAEIYS